MKQNTLSFAVAAAGAHQVAATFGEIAGLINGVAGVGANVAANVAANVGAGVGAGLGAGVGAGASFNFDMGFSTAKSFNCPLNVVNKCTPEQEKGWDFSGLKKGSFDSYLGFQFGGGWTCEDSVSKRGMLSGRTFGEIEKVISAICPLGAALNIGVGAQAGVDLFSIGSFDISTEFDARLEFHYDMPDGSVCKHFSDCKKGGSTIVNNQCGGAKKVHIVYPKTSTNVKKSCKISCHKIKWHCGPPQVQPSLPATTISPPASQTTPTAPGTTDTQPGQQTTPTVPGTTDTQPGQQTTPTVPGTTDTQPGQQTTPNVPGTTAPPAGSTTNAVCTGSTTTTSIPNCGPSMPECAGKTGPQVVTVVVPMTGSDCAPTTPGYPANPQTDNSAKPTGEVPQTTGVTPGTPTQAPPCPPVVPRCLNTFLDLKAKCKDNKDAGCYCPNKDFVNVIFNCIYAHGENDNIISEAISFFQGMCAPYIPQNPAIATGCQPIIEIITVTGTPRITDVPYTKIVYTGTNGDHQTVPVEVTVPNIAMPTAPAGQPGVSGAQPTAPGAQPTAPAGGACTPGTDACPPAAPGSPGAQPTAPAGGACTPGAESCPPAAPGTPGTPGAPGVEPVGPPAASGTGMVPTGPSGVPVTAGVGRVGAGMMIAAVAFLAAL